MARFAYMLFKNHRAWADPEGGGTGGPDPLFPLKSLKDKGFLSKTGPNPQKPQSYQLGHHGHASKTPFKWRYPGGPMMPRSRVVFSILSPLIN